MSTAVESTPRPRGRAKSARATSEARLGWLLAGPAFFVMLFVVLYPILQALYDLSLIHI